MFNFNSKSGWSLELELECFVIYKQLENAGFSRGLQSELCEKLASRCKLDSGTLKAKVGNFKSELGHTGPTNSSKATRYVVEQYGHRSLKEAEALLAGYQLAVKQMHNGALFHLRGGSMNPSVKIETEYGVIKGRWSDTDFKKVFVGALFKQGEKILEIEFSLPSSFIDNYGEPAVLDEIKNSVIGYIKTGASS